MRNGAYFPLFLFFDFFRFTLICSSKGKWVVIVGQESPTLWFRLEDMFQLILMAQGIELVMFE